ncbi:MAG: vanadium-dependent haloperoxidase [Pseudomonadota bacterium]
MARKKLTRHDASFKYRRDEAAAAKKRTLDQTAASKPPLHKRNQDELLLSKAHWAMSFTKGLEHDPKTGLVATNSDAVKFRRAIDSGDIRKLTLGGFDVPPQPQGRRKWEAPTAGFVFDLQGPDAQAVTMPPAPALNAIDNTLDELAFEMAEVYELALLRDVPFSAFQDGSKEPRMFAALHRLSNLEYVNKAPGRLPKKHPTWPDGDRRPRQFDENGSLSPQTVFRGSSIGNEVGPYLSQFLLMGSFDGPLTPPEDQGQIAFGNQFIDQRVRNATLTDWMITWRDWLAVQNGADVRSNETLFAAGRRFIHTPRDLATYVHDDALYQAYLNACLLLLGMGTPTDPAFAELAGGPIPVNSRTSVPNNSQGFALFGGPHILSLVTEVATRGLKAVRYQKFQNHLRLRPETLAGRLARVREVEQKIANCAGTAGHIEGRFELMANQLEDTMTAVRQHNVARGGDDLPLLPMAFQEGSPMHPAYGAGHATVAGACVTMLKAFFDTSALLTWKEGSVAFRLPKKDSCEPDGIPVQFVTTDDGARLEMQQINEPLTLLGELNKLAANISIGRNMAGVHYFSDYYDSVRMGEEIAVGILEEQAQGYGQNDFGLTLMPFNRSSARSKPIVIQQVRPGHPAKRVTVQDLRST